MWELEHTAILVRPDGVEYKIKKRGCRRGVHNKEPNYFEIATGVAEVQLDLEGVQLLHASKV